MWFDGMDRRAKRRNARAEDEEHEQERERERGRECRHRAEGRNSHMAASLSVSRHSAQRMARNRQLQMYLFACDASGSVLLASSLLSVG
jgi:hypothetical protein